MQLPSEAGPPPATQSDNIDDAYEKFFSDPTDELLNELNQAEGIQESASVNATSTLSPVADPPQVMQTIPPSAAGHAQADDPIPQKSPPTKSRQCHASPPVKLTPHGFALGLLPPNSLTPLLQRRPILSTLSPQNHHLQVHQYPVKFALCP